MHNYNDPHFKYDMYIVSIISRFFTHFSVFSLQQKAEKAMQQFDRVETSRTVQDLETEIIKKQKYIDEEERK